MSQPFTDERGDSIRIEESISTLQRGVNCGGDYEQKELTRTMTRGSLQVNWNRISINLKLRSIRQTFPLFELSCMIISASYKSKRHYGASIGVEVDCKLYDEGIY